MLPPVLDANTAHLPPASTAACVRGLRGAHARVMSLHGFVTHTTPGTAPTTSRRRARICAKNDPVLGKLIARRSVRNRAGRNRVRGDAATIVSQQLSGKAADSIYARGSPPRWAQGRRSRSIIRVLSEEQLRVRPLAVKHRMYAIVASHFGENALHVALVRQARRCRRDQALTSIKGVGEWSAHIPHVCAPSGRRGSMRRPRTAQGHDENIRPALQHQT